jgi:hypothetical protein
MTRRRLLALGAVLVPAGAAAQEHWLVGRWRGESQGEAGQNRRTLIIRAVQGSQVTAIWGQAEIQATLSGDTLRFATANGNNPVVLRRTGPDRLEGTVATRGGAGPTHSLWLERQVRRGRIPDAL